MASILDMFGLGGGAPGVNPLTSIFDSILGREASGPSLPGMPAPERQASSNDPTAPSMLGNNLLKAGQGLISSGAPTTQPPGMMPMAGMGMQQNSPGQWPLHERILRGLL